MTWPPGSMTATRGFSLLEVLIASTMFSLGMAGLCALLLVNLGDTAESRNSSIAASAAADLAAQIRLHPLVTDRYLNPPASVAQPCLVGNAASGSAMCSPQQQADYDFAVWKRELADLIRNSAAIVCQDSSPDDGDRYHPRCDGAGAIVIKIFWGGPASNSDQASSEYRYTLVSL